MAKKRGVPGEVVGEINGLPIRRLQVGEITGAPYNPRTITAKALAALKTSRERFGLVQAIVWNKRTRHIVGGHQRLKTLEPDEFTDVVEVNLSLDEEKALNLTLNNPAVGGDWTTELAKIVATLQTNVPDLSEALLIPDLVTEIPTDIDELLGPEEGEDGVDEAEHSEGGGGEPGDDEEEGEGGDTEGPIRKIVLVPAKNKYDKVVALLEEVMENEGCATQTEAVVFLLERYHKGK